MPAAGIVHEGARSLRTRVRRVCGALSSTRLRWRPATFDESSVPARRLGQRGRLSASWRAPVSEATGGARSEQTFDVLVVDDEDSVRSSICEILGTAGITTGEASDGQVALEKLQAGRFRAMVVDVRMPRLDGLALLQTLSDPPPAILVSAYAIGPDVRERLEGKVLAYLQKPFRPEELLKAINSALGRAES